MAATKRPCVKVGGNWAPVRPASQQQRPLLSTDATAMKVTVHDFRSIVARGLSDQSEAADQHIDRHREYERRKYSVQCAFSAGERVGRAGAD